MPQRKRSVTFASEHVPSEGNQLPVINDEIDETMTEMGVDQIVNETIFNDETSRPLSYREEGDRLLSNAIEHYEVQENLESHQLVNKELKDLYEMQVYEQRKLHETINDVKRHVEFLYNGITLPNEASSRQPNFNEPVVHVGEAGEILNTSLSFIETAKDRLNYLENEGQLIEQNYRDYQHKIKSKYYPINDDDENEIQLVTKKKNATNTLDIEKFLESTLKVTFYI